MKLTDDQIKKLADQLIDTCSNVYRVAERMGEGVVINDDDFDRLEKLGGVFKCEECNRWKSLSEKDRSVDCMCVECVDEIDGDDENDA